MLNASNYSLAVGLAMDVMVQGGPQEMHSLATGLAMDVIGKGGPQEMHSATGLPTFLTVCVLVPLPASMSRDRSLNLPSMVTFT